MSRSRSRLAADWFAKLRVNAGTQAVEHEDVEVVDAATTTALAAKADTTYVNTSIGNIDMTAKADVTYVDNALSSISSSNLSSDFTVEAGKTVTAGEVVNFAAGKIGANPVVNTMSDVVADATNDFTVMNESGTIALYFYRNGSSQHAVKTGVVQANGSITWNSEVVIESGYTSASSSIEHLWGDNFVIRSSHSPGWSGASWYSQRTASWFMRLFSVHPTTGAVSVSSSRTASTTGYGGGASGSFTVRSLGASKVGISSNWFRYTAANNAGSGASASSHTSSSFVSSGGISTSGTNDTQATQFHNSHLVASSSKLLGASGANWYLGTWNGTNVSSVTTIVMDANYDSQLLVYRLPSTDIFLAVYKTLANNYVMCTFSYASGVLTKTSTFTILELGADVSSGGVNGVGNTFNITYKDGANGYIQPFTVNSSTGVVEGTGVPTVHNKAGSIPLIYGPNNTNKYTAVYSSSANKANSSVLTLNSYNSPALSWIGVATENGSSGATVKVTLDGVATGFSSLVPGTLYYYNTIAYDGSVTSDLGSYLIGTAISTTEIKLNG